MCWQVVKFICALWTSTHRLDILQFFRSNREYFFTQLISPNKPTSEIQSFHTWLFLKSLTSLTTKWSQSRCSKWETMGRFMDEEDNLFVFPWVHGPRKISFIRASTFHEFYLAFKFGRLHSIHIQSLPSKLISYTLPTEWNEWSFQSMRLNRQVVHLEECK